VVLELVDQTIKYICSHSMKISHLVRFKVFNAAESDEDVHHGGVEVDVLNHVVDSVDIYIHVLDNLLRPFQNPE